MASKNYVFYYDLPGGDGPDERPSKADIDKTFKRVADIIVEEQPDVVLLQEIDQNADRTDNEDQIARLWQMLAEKKAGYTCRASAWYWKASFLPHPRIMGRVGMKVATFSRYKLQTGRRYQLPLIPADFVYQQFNLKRAVLDTPLEVKGGQSIHILNTHFDAFSQGSDTMTRQVAVTMEIVNRLDQDGKPWLLGGDLNLLPSKKAYKSLGKVEQGYYNPDTELAPMIARFKSIPPRAAFTADNPKEWYTHYPNNPIVKGPDRIIDYIFYSSRLKVMSPRVRSADVLDISDHFPVIGTFTAAGKPAE